MKMDENEKSSKENELLQHDDVDVRKRKSSISKVSELNERRNYVL